jgi:RecA/RadA recombinase
MAKAKKQLENDDVGILDDIVKKLKTKAIVMDDTLEDFLPWRVPFKHKGLHKITGGLLGGKLMIIEGFSQTGKSWLAYELMGNAIKMGGVAYLVDTERAFEPAYGKASGIDFKTKRFVLDETTVLENIFVSWEDFIKDTRPRLKDKSKPIVLILDSASSTRCKEQYANDQSGKDTGYGFMKRANAMYEGIDKLIPIIDEYHASIVIINQLREDKSGGMFVDPTKSMFPNLIYRATQILRGKLSSVEKDENDKDKKLGMSVRWETFKNRFVKPKQVIKIKYHYEKGLAPYSGLFDVLMRENEVVKAEMKDPNDARKKIKGCYVVGDETKTFWALSDAAKMFEVHPHLLEPKFVKTHEEDDGNIEDETDDSIGIEDVE